MESVSNDNNETIVSDVDVAFRNFIAASLGPILIDQTSNLISNEALNLYFSKVFVNKSYTEWQEDNEWIYNPLEKIGKKTFDASFQLWLHVAIGNEPTLLQAYSDIEQIFTGARYLGELADILQFTRYINITSVSANNNEAENVEVDEADEKEDIEVEVEILNNGKKLTVYTDALKMSIFHSFVGAIVMAGDNYIVKDFGFVLAKKWVKAILDINLKDKLNLEGMAHYTNRVMALNDIWLFKNWGSPIYRQVFGSEAAKKARINGFAAVDLVAPNIEHFPDRIRGKLMGSGVGKNLTQATLKAAEMGFDTLGINYVEFKQLEVQFDRYEQERSMDDSLVRQLLAFDPMLFSTAMRWLNDKENKDKYDKLAVRYLKIYDRYSTQIRYQDEEGKWVNLARGEDSTLNKALAKAFGYFNPKQSKEKIVTPVENK